MAATASADPRGALWRELVPAVRHRFSSVLGWLAARVRLPDTPPRTLAAAGSPASAPLPPAAEPDPAPVSTAASGTRAAVERQSRCLVELAGTVSRARRARASETGEDWTDLMARVSHDLRTPLNAVIGFSDVMNAELLGPVGNPRYREYARHIRDCGRELLKSAEDTLTFTALLAQPHIYGQRAPIEIAALAHDAWAFYAEEAANRGVRFELIARDGLEVLGERRPLRQALINLFSEALARIGDGGLIALVARADCDLVELEITADGAPGEPGTGHASLAVCLARALLELQGASLVELSDRTSAWRAATILPCAAQPDFFELARGAASNPGPCVLTL